MDSVAIFAKVIQKETTTHAEPARTPGLQSSRDEDGDGDGDGGRDGDGDRNGARDGDGDRM